MSEERWTAEAWKRYRATGEEPAGQAKSHPKKGPSGRRTARRVPKVPLGAHIDPQALAAYHQANSEAYNTYIHECDVADDAAYARYLGKEVEAARACVAGEGRDE